MQATDAIFGQTVNLAGDLARFGEFTWHEHQSCAYRAQAWHDPRSCA